MPRIGNRPNAPTSVAAITNACSEPSTCATSDARSLRSLRRQRGVFRPCTEYSELPEIQGGVYAGGIASRAGYAVDLAVDDDADVLVASEIGRAPNAVDRADQGEDDREPNEDRRLPNSEERFHVMPPVEVNGPPKIGSDVQTRIGNFCQ